MDQKVLLLSIIYVLSLNGIDLEICICILANINDAIEFWETIDDFTTNPNKVQENTGFFKNPTCCCAPAELHGGASSLILTGEFLLKWNKLLVEEVVWLGEMSMGHCPLLPRNSVVGL